MNVILFGYRGSGKTTVGVQLAQRLGKTFVDVDQESCRRFGNDSIAEIWQEHGEPAWRETEVQVTRELVARSGHVIALGGGTLMQPGARAAVEQAEQAVRVYLRCDAAELFKRIQADSTSVASRPSLTGLGGGIEEVTAVLTKRDPVYRAVADHVLDVTELSPGEVTQRVLEAVLNDCPQTEG